MVEELKCISCKKPITNDVGCVKFNCPNCGKYEIIRCKNCREIVAKYVCPNCKFEGPN
jgi:Zn-ribbon RNA-binding protein